MLNFTAPYAVLFRMPGRSLASTLIQTQVNLARPDSWSLWEIERKAATGSRGTCAKWVDSQQLIPHFPPVQMAGNQLGSVLARSRMGVIIMDSTCRKRRLRSGCYLPLPRKSSATGCGFLSFPQASRVRPGEITCV